MVNKQATNLQPPENPIVLGKLGAAYGIRGWLRVFRPPNMLKVFLSISLGLSRTSGQWQQIEIEDWKHHNKDIIVKLNGLTTAMQLPAD
ncbi:hypothetical protein ACLK1S_16165 [Escherichia coli]